MAQTTSPAIVNVLEKELESIDSQIHELHAYRQSLQSILGRHQIKSHSAAARPVKSFVADKTGHNTMAMARTVLQNLGGATLTMKELREAIQKTYGVTPAKTLDQMISRRATLKKDFYTTPDHRYGLIQARAGIESIHVPSSAIA